MPGQEPGELPPVLLRWAAWSLPELFGRHLLVCALAGCPRRAPARRPTGVGHAHTFTTADVYFGRTVPATGAAALFVVLRASRVVPRGGVEHRRVANRTSRHRMRTPGGELENYRRIAAALPHPRRCRTVANRLQVIEVRLAGDVGSGDRFVVRCTSAAADRDRAIRERLVTELGELIAGTDQSVVVVVPDVVEQPGAGLWCAPCSPESPGRFRSHRRG